MPNTGSRSHAVIVTGGASGIGLATTERLLASGWRVAAFDRDQTAIAKLRNMHGDKVRADVLDVTDEQAVEATVKSVATAFGRLDGVVNSAGIGIDIHVLETSVSQFRNVLDINVTGTFIVGARCGTYHERPGRRRHSQHSIDRRSARIQGSRCLWCL